MDVNEQEITERFSLKIWGSLVRYVIPLKREVIFVAVTMLLSAIVDALIPIFTYEAVGRFVEPRSIEGIGKFTVIYISIILFQSLTTVLYSRQAMVIEMRVAQSLKHDCFIHLQKLPLSFYNQTSVGYILARVMSDTNRISAMIAWVGSNFIWNLFYLIGIVGFMFALNWKLALIVTLCIPIITAITLYFQPKLLAANRDLRRSNSQITSAFNESITGAKTTKTLVIEDRITAEFREMTSELYRSSRHSIQLSAIYVPLITFFGSLAVALVLTNGGGSVILGDIDIKTLSAFIAYGIAILDPMSHLGRFFSEIMAAQVNIERVNALLAQPVTIQDPEAIEEIYGGVFNPKPENWEPIRGDIEFENVWFRYSDAAEDDFVLRDVNLKIPAGTTVAIVGETGAGKSTLVNLACRFFEPTQGNILIDGVDYRERGQIWLRSNIGYVQQSPHLFSGSLRDNIRYGKLDATDEEIERAAKLASVDTVVEKLEQGYDTDMGEGGDRLSTGEKQLVSFARAAIANPPIFVLDEATSSIDTETEQLIQNAISHVLEGRTSFIIAHRLSTIRSADLILLIDRRGIAERGTHDELMEAQGQYYRLYSAMTLKEQDSELGGFRA